MFRLSKRSHDRLFGVNPRLVAVVNSAIGITKVDFGVVEGLRTMATQEAYVKAGKSQTMNSKHLTGDAVDLMAFVNGAVSWELNLYDEIAEAMRIGALEHDLPLRWGAAWNIPDIRRWDGNMESAMSYYIDERRRQNRRPFIDAPHFEIG
ncbi:MAG: M15 family metallopeptidase [Ignavibacteria bacterium]|nr:M15 family metallopeptidase [Ignavibacteria bacterium]